MTQRWTIRDGDPRAREELSRALSVSGLLAAVLVARGIAMPDPARAFLSPTLGELPDPSGIPGMDAGARRLAEAVMNGASLWVYADYDVDGVTSAALLTEFLAQCGARPRVHLPRRDREGYGLHASALEEIAAQGGQLVVTADCGIAAVGAARRAVELGLELIITDHHAPGDELPLAAAVVNPKLPGSAYPEPAPAGVGVAWNLAAATRRELRLRGWFDAAGRAEPDLRDLLDLVALGTVADVVPLRGANRVLVRHGLEVLNRVPRAGVVALREVAGVRGTLRGGHIGFQLGPRLNAAGRMGDPLAALQLLTSSDPGEAGRLAGELDRVNRERQTEERGIADAAVARVAEEQWWPQRWSLVVDGEGWHPGVIGIVASRLVERYHRPAVVLGVVDGQARGSARSIRGLDLHRALGQCADLLTRFGGHAAAAGLQLPEEQVPGFRARFEAAVRDMLGEEDLVPELVVDAEVAFSELHRDAVADLVRLEPFGPGNPGPVLVSRGLTLVDLRTMGQEQEHIKLRLEQGGRSLDAVAWRQASEFAALRRGAVLDVAFSPEVNFWNGAERVQLTIRGVRER
ncbi:MAG TPA: single-stranded-DNA-specific exonuclease RecJ [Deferrisomatales bacterium]|nr:single-stranded-DNA-specific exonuclease RecJ [Deferrisomatales bacterium]